MTSPAARRHPLPALLALLALLVLAALVWVRLAHRGDSSAAAAPCRSPSAASSSAAAPSPAASSSAAASLPAASAVTVTVLNSTQRTGIAGDAQTALRHRGFRAPEAATDDPSAREVRGVAEIRYGPGGAQGARLLRYYLPGATLVPGHEHGSTVVVSIGAKYHDVASKAAAKRAIQAAASSAARASSPAPTTPPAPSRSC